MEDIELREKFDYQFKLILVGDSGAGKSCILNKYLSGGFTPQHKLTIGVEFGMRYIHVEDKTVKLQVWDTAGQERFRSVTRSYYRGSLGILVVYDLTQPGQTERVKQWLSEVKQFAHQSASYLIVGNKKDLAETQRQTESLDMAQLAQDQECMFVETSAQSGENIDAAFGLLTNSIINKVNSGEIGIDAVTTKTSMGNSSSGKGLDEIEAGAGGSGRCGC